VPVRTVSSPDVNVTRSVPTTTTIPVQTAPSQASEVAAAVGSGIVGQSPQPGPGPIGGVNPPPTTPSGPVGTPVGGERPIGPIGPPGVFGQGSDRPAAPATTKEHVGRPRRHCNASSHGRRGTGEAHIRRRRQSASRVQRQAVRAPWRPPPSLHASDPSWRRKALGAHPGVRAYRQVRWRRAIRASSRADSISAARGAGAA